MSVEDFLSARIADDEAVARKWGAVRMVAECEAKRAIIDLASEATGLDMSVDNDRCVGPRDEAVEPYCGDSILYALAAIYSYHPDYRQEWKVPHE